MMKRIVLFILSALIILCLSACQDTPVSTFDGEAVNNSVAADDESVDKEPPASETEAENEAADVELPEETESDEAGVVEEPEEAEVEDTEVAEDEIVADAEVKEEDRTETADDSVIIEEETELVEEPKAETEAADEKKDNIRLISADEQYEYKTYSFQDPVTLKVKLVNDNGETISDSVEIAWHQCFENGDIIDTVGYGDTFAGNAFQMGFDVEPGYYYATAGGIYEHKLKSDIFKVTPEYRYKIVSEDGHNEYRIYNHNETVELKVKIVNSNGETVERGRFEWFLCREDGEVLYTGGGSIASGDTYICNDEYYKFYYNEDNIRYYRVIAGMEDYNSFGLSSIFKVELIHPEGKTESDYKIVSADGQYDRQISSTHDAVEFKANVIDKNGVPAELLNEIEWYACYENGEERYISDGYGPGYPIVGNGDTLYLDSEFLGFISEAEWEGFPICFKAVAAAKDGFLLESDVFKLNLVP